MYEKDLGIILNSYLSQEADKVVIVFFRRHGKMSLVFKGVRKSKSRKLNSAEMGNVAEFFFFRKHEQQLPYLKEIMVKNHFQKIKKNYHKYLYLNLISELFQHIILPGETNLKLFNFLLNILVKLKDTKEGLLRQLMLYIELKVLQLSGIMPEPGVCQKCHRSHPVLYYSQSSNEFHCPGCKEGDESASFMLDQRHRVMLERLNRSNIKNVEHLSLSKGMADDLEGLFYQMLTRYLHKELKSYKIIGKMRNDEHTGIG